MAEPSLSASLRALGLTPGQTTVRKQLRCESGDAHTILYDAKSQWDMVAQRHVVTDPGEPFCDDCGRESRLEAEDFHALNRHALQTLRKELRRRLRDLVTMVNGAAEPDCEWIREACSRCGAPTPLIDCYAEYDPVLDGFELTTTFDKGHICKSCNSETRVHIEVLSAHERLPLSERVAAEFASLSAEIADVDSWLAENGETYGMTPEDLIEIRDALQSKTLDPQ
jgi:hypothetical protein